MLNTYPKYGLLALLCGILGYAPYGQALTTPSSTAPVVLIQHASFDVTPSVTHYASGASLSAPQAGRVAPFFQSFSATWEIGWDERGDRPNLIQGVGVPLLPGSGNSLQIADLGLPAGQSLDMSVVAQRLRQFMQAHTELFRVAPGDLSLHPDSTAYGANARLWLVDFEVSYQGVPIRGARVFFRINSGNIVQFGTEFVGDVAISVQSQVSSAEAVARVLQRASVAPSAAVDVVQDGVLKIYPELTAGESPGEPYSGTPGAGYAYRLVREVDFRLPADGHTYRGVVDAQSGDVLEISELDQYVAATVSGGIYPKTNTDAEVVRPFDDTQVRNGSKKITDENGVYDYTGGKAKAKLRGPLVLTNDTCGKSKLINTTNGNLNFGTSGGTDCTTPGIGGPGNTHASRTAFYHLNLIKDTATSFLPANAWLKGTLPSNVNIVDTCNAFWNGSSVNFFRSGDGCSNTGEIAAVMYHEFGHGLDQNTGGAASEGGSGEAVGDIVAYLETQDSCIGPNFQPGVPCFNCGSTGCTGVRDLRPFALGGAATDARPNTVADNAGINCDRFTCPSSCRGPMGYECHCESYIASTAAYDLTQALITRYGTGLGFATMEDIWYGSLTSSKSAYQVVAGGTCNPNATVNGCGATNWYTVLLAVDDNDGNLANGTPNGCRIWDAFTAHGIACGARPACTPPPP